MTKSLLTLALVAMLAACSRNPDPEYAPDDDDAGGDAPAAQAQAEVTASADVAVAVATPRMSDEDAMRHGREAAAQLFAQDVAPLWARFVDEMQEALESEAAFAESVGRILGQIGAEGNVVSEEIVAPAERPGVAVYVRRSSFPAVSRDAILTIAFNADGSIAGMRINPAE